MQKVIASPKTGLKLDVAEESPSFEAKGALYFY